MPEFKYANPPVIFWGPKSVDRLASELDRLGSRLPVLVTTRSLVEAAKRLPFTNAPPATVVIGQHAPAQQVESAYHAALEANADGVVSFGGGSPIDGGKMLAVRLADQRSMHDRAVPHVAVPTTLSVAELASGAGYTDASGNKAGMRDPRLLPDSVIYDPELALMTPLDLWLSTGIRALDHAVEGFLADGEHPFNDVMALDAIQRLFKSLPAAKARPDDVDVRSENQLAAWFSFTLPGASASGLSHVMGKQIGARHGIPHGVTSCLLLPHVMRYLGRSNPRRMKLLGVTADEVQDLISGLGLPQHITAYGIGEPELRTAASELAGKYPESDLLKIYTAAL